MPERDPDDVTLNTLHEDLTAGFGQMHAGFADLKATMVAGFRGMPSRESSDETVRLLREANRLNEGRYAQLDAQIRDQHLQTGRVLHAIAEGQDRLVEAQRLLVEGQNSLSTDIRALIARIDAIIRGRDNGEPPA